MPIRVVASEYGGSIGSPSCACRLYLTVLKFCLLRDIASAVAHHRQPQFPGLFHNQCQIPRLFRVFQMSGHPVN